VRIAFRVDASLEIGTGHVMRCLALAAAARARGATIRFVCRELPGHLAARIHAQGFELALLPAPAGAGAHGTPHAHWLGVPFAADARETAAALAGAKPDWLVVDHYALDAAWERALRAHAGAIAVIDDLADRPHDCDLLVDAAGAPGAPRYDGLLPDGARRLAGPRYAPLRAEFAVLHAARPPRDGTLERIFVSFGGADAPGATCRAVEALAALAPRPRAVDAIAGLASPHAARLQRLCAAHAGFTAHTHVDDVAALMARADLAIGGGGTMAWERACLGLPSLIRPIAGNQRPYADFLAAAGAARVLGEDDLAPARLQALFDQLRRGDALARMGAAAAALVDGRGAMRLARILVPPGALRLRRAHADDRERLLEWRNAGSVRRHASDPAPIDAATHARWLAGLLADPARNLFVAESADGPVGVLRYDVEGAVAVVSLYLVPTRLGQGWGVHVLETGRNWLRGARPEVRALHARIAPANAASRAVFRDAGFHPAPGDATGLFVQNLGSRRDGGTA
jgi:UDP-2,4-diacetamido-2,4,6-trideoxy-beta-L-altropyranose hydrolase